MGAGHTGLTNYRGQQHYRPFHKIKQRYMINAKVLEKAVLDALFEVLSNDRALTKAVFDGNPLGKVADELRTRYGVYEKELKSVEKRASNALNVITNFEGEDMGSFLQDLKDRIRNLEQMRLDLTFKMQSIDNQLRALPTYEEIRTKREWMRKQLMQRTMESYFASGHAFTSLSFESKRKIVTLIFGGKDENGKRYGIYVRPLGGNPTRYKVVAYGRLGNIDGWVESKTGRYSSDTLGIWNREDTPEAEAQEDLARVIRDSDPGFLEEYQENETASANYKAHMLSQGSPA